MSKTPPPATMDDLRVRRLAAQVAAIELTNQRIAGKMLPLDEVTGRWDIGCAILQEEAKPLMDGPTYHDFIVGIRARIMELDQPEESS